eukprot:scaffold1300_cov317-Prasinococcus_capsulatus_cf.AAC.11
MRGWSLRLRAPKRPGCGSQGRGARWRNRSPRPSSASWWWKLAALVAAAVAGRASMAAYRARAVASAAVAHHLRLMASCGVDGYLCSQPLRNAPDNGPRAEAGVSARCCIQGFGG